MAGCPANTHYSGTGASSNSSCICDAGYSYGAGSTYTCGMCPAGFYCPSETQWPLACPANTMSPIYSAAITVCPSYPSAHAVASTDALWSAELYLYTGVRAVDGGVRGNGRELRQVQRVAVLPERRGAAVPPQRLRGHGKQRERAEQLHLRWGYALLHIPKGHYGATDALLGQDGIHQRAPAGSARCAPSTRTAPATRPTTRRARPTHTA